MENPILVPRDPAANIIKTDVVNYRPMATADQNCLFCIRKQGVPWMWCDEVGRQAETGMVCDKFKGADRGRC